MARAGKVRAIDIRNAWWHDIDTSDALKYAEAMSGKLGSGRIVSARRPALSDQYRTA
jgi:hypothetical protein